jgi:hypothetical protein
MLWDLMNLHADLEPRPLYSINLISNPLPSHTIAMPPRKAVATEGQESAPRRSTRISSQPVTEQLQR